MFSSHPTREGDREAHLNYYASGYNRGRQLLHRKTKLNQIQQNRPTRINLNYLMAALWNRANHYILPCGFFHFVSSIFLQRAQCSHCKRCISYSNSVCLSVRPSVRLSVTRRYCVKTTARSTVQFALSDSKMCLVL